MTKRLVEARGRAHVRRPLLILAAAILLVPATLEARAPDPGDTVAVTLDEVRRQLAMGELDEAVASTEALHQRHPDDARVFWALVRAYAAAGLDGEKLIPLLTERVETVPNSDRALRELGAAHARIGEYEAAHRVWRLLLDRPIPDESLYSEVGSMEIQARMYREAVEVYDEGRERLERPTLFSQELARALTSYGDYDRAFDECVTTVEAHPGLVQWAVNRVELMLELGASERMILGKTTALTEASDVIPPVLSMAGSIFVVFDRPDEALDAFLRSDELTGHGGRSLVESGAILEEKGWVREAREAYGALMERYPRSTNAAMGGMRAALLDSKLGEHERAVASLNELAQVFAGKSAGAQALLEAARIELEALADADRSLATLERLTLDFAKLPDELLEDVELLKIAAYLSLGRLDDVYDAASRLAAGPGTRDVKSRAMFERAYVSFQRGDAERSLEEFRELISNDVSGHLVNDALRLMLLVSEAQESGDTETLAVFATAHLASRTGKTELARELLSSIVDPSLETPVAVAAAMLDGALAEDAGDTRAALAVYARVAGSSAPLSARAEAMIRTGDIHADGGRNDEALGSYRAVIDELPPNFLSGEARRKIERLARREAG